MKQVSWARQGLEPESPGAQLRALTPFQVLLRVSGILTTYTLSSLSHNQVPSHLHCQDLCILGGAVQFRDGREGLLNRGQIHQEAGETSATVRKQDLDPQK